MFIIAFRHKRSTLYFYVGPFKTSKEANDYVKASKMNLRFTVSELYTPE